MQSPPYGLGAESPREAELHEVLSAYVEPRAVSYRFVLGFVALGLVGCVWVAWAVSKAPTQVPLRFEHGAPSTLEDGIAAFHRGDWDEAEHLLQKTRAFSPQAALRLDDYMERLALIRRDGERLARAEDALDAGDAERALALAGLVGENSPLYAQAEVLSRSARAEVEAAVSAKQAVRAEVDAEREASRAAAARVYAPAPAEPPRSSEKRRGVPGRTQGGSSADEEW